MKILTFDIETGIRANLAFGTGKNWLRSDDFIDPAYFLGFSWKWLEEDKVGRLFLHDVNKKAVKDKNDKKLVQKLWKLLDEADAVVTYNGNGFDIKVFNAKCLEYGMPPPSPFKSIDLFPVAKRKFRLDDKKLDTVAKTLGIGGKNPMTKQDWVDCYFGDLEAFEKMAVYCDKDVALTEEVYKKLRPWIDNHPNMSQFLGGVRCTKCGSTDFDQEKGGWTIPYANGKKYKRHVCQNCGSHFVNKTIYTEQEKKHCFNA